MMICLMWPWRRFLGRSGALIAAILLVVSPIMLYYGRYVREDVYACFSGVLMLYAVLRYLEGGERKYLYLVTVALAIHFLDKETSFIYTAELLIFLAFFFIAQVTRRTWEDNEALYRGFIYSLAFALIVGIAAGGYFVITHKAAAVSATQTAIPSDPNATASPIAPAAGAAIPVTAILAVVAVLALAAAAYFLIRGYGWERVRNERSFDLLMVCGLIVLPMLSPLPHRVFRSPNHAAGSAFHLDHRRVSGPDVCDCGRDRSTLESGEIF
jgi:4-amino-4-deoxy-L-arabinose transferase-like glycosyltransferase